MIPGDHKSVFRDACLWFWNWRCLFAGIQMRRDWDNHILDTGYCLDRRLSPADWSLERPHD